MLRRRTGASSGRPEIKGSLVLTARIFWGKALRCLGPFGESTPCLFDCADRGGANYKRVPLNCAKAADWGPWAELGDKVVAADME
jgi:hypothetical protein